VFCSTKVREVIILGLQIGLAMFALALLSICLPCLLINELGKVIFFPWLLLSHAAV
jgi:hypothetical protein